MKYTCHGDGIRTVAELVRVLQQLPKDTEIYDGVGNKLNCVVYYHGAKVPFASVMNENDDVPTNP